MYRYDHYDAQLVKERVAQFRSQTERYLAGQLTEDEFRPLRLQNGLYIQRHAPMLRVAIPYGLFSSTQMRTLAHIARTEDRGFAHFTTRQNLQFNWVQLERVPDILAQLAEVEMHAIQTSGNCIRNTTTDALAGVAADEVIDPRPYCELIRQWSTFHPEFAFLPRKFKIAVTGSVQDRSAAKVHDIGLEAVRNEAGEIGFRVLVGGGLGRTPIIGSVIRHFLPEKHLLSYLEAILRLYNRAGRRDNKYKARIKILVKAMTPEGFAARVENEWLKQLKESKMTLPAPTLEKMKAHFSAPAYLTQVEGFDPAALNQIRNENAAFARWFERNVRAHQQPHYHAVLVSLKPHGKPPGDITADQMVLLADLADQYSFGELRATHEQNVVLADVHEKDLFAVWEALKAAGLATPNLGLLTDVICCPGGDFCALANARSIPIAQAIQERFDQLDYLFDIGDIELNISGCMNACGHHHIGHIGILGVDKQGAEFYQVSLGGSQGNTATLGKVIGPSFSQEAIPDVIEKIIQVYIEQRTEGEQFIETFRRIGLDLFKERVYGNAH